MRLQSNKRRENKVTILLPKYRDLTLGEESQRAEQDSNRIKSGDRGVERGWVMKSGVEREDSL